MEAKNTGKYKDLCDFDLGGQTGVSMGTISEPWVLVCTKQCILGTTLLSSRCFFFFFPRATHSCTSSKHSASSFHIVHNILYLFFQISDNAIPLRSPSLSNPKSAEGKRKTLSNAWSRIVNKNELLGKGTDPRSCRQVCAPGCSTHPAGRTEVRRRLSHSCACCCCGPAVPRTGSSPESEEANWNRLRSV